MRHADGRFARRWSGASTPERRADLLARSRWAASSRSRKSLAWSRFSAGLTAVFDGRGVRFVRRPGDFVRNRVSYAERRGGGGDLERHRTRKDATQFYAWHLHEHMPERVGIPGFRRGRRYIAADAATHPEFFTLYEADTMRVLQGRITRPAERADRRGRSARPRASATRRARIARVRDSTRPGAGGACSPRGSRRATTRRGSGRARAECRERAAHRGRASLCRGR